MLVAVVQFEMTICNKTLLVAVPVRIKLVSARPDTVRMVSQVLPLSDLSRPQTVNVDDFEEEVKQMNRTFKPGSRIGGIKINSPFKGKKGQGEPVFGKFEGFKVDKKTKTIRAFITDPKSLKVFEVYPETLSRLNEAKSHLAKTFLEFVI